MPIYGFPDECKKFDERNPEFYPGLARLVDALNLAFTRIHDNPNVTDRFIYLFGRMCVEDFMEIVLVSMHGYGAAAMKLLRSMYEHTVTLRYLFEHPDGINTFMDYYHVQQDKLMRPMLETFGQGILAAETIAEVKRKAQAVKDKFMVIDCVKCGTKRLNHTWSKLDFVSMAKQAGEIGGLIVPGYFLPLRQAHSTFGGLTDRLEVVSNVMGFRQESEEKMVDTSLMTAHHCILNVIEIQAQHFKIGGLPEAWQSCSEDFLRIWAPDSKCNAANS
ncbi:MAG: DUF5677 domain-containing protein [Terriglobales bacterium]